MLRNATIVAFPTSRLTMQDRAELARWSAISDQYGWQVGADGGPAVETTPDGMEHLRIRLRAVADDAVYFVSRSRGLWEVLDRRGQATTFHSLRLALESICPTLWHGAAQVLAAQTPLPA